MKVRAACGREMCRDGFFEFTSHARNIVAPYPDTRALGYISSPQNHILQRAQHAAYNRRIRSTLVVTDCFEWFAAHLLQTINTNSRFIICTSPRENGDPGECVDPHGSRELLERLTMHDVWSDATMLGVRGLSCLQHSPRIGL